MAYANNLGVTHPEIFKIIPTFDEIKVLNILGRVQTRSTLEVMNQMYYDLADNDYSASTQFRTERNYMEITRHLNELARKKFIEQEEVEPRLNWQHTTFWKLTPLGISFYLSLDV